MASGTAYEVSCYNCILHGNIPLRFIGSACTTSTYYAAIKRSALLEDPFHWHRQLLRLAAVNDYNRLLLLERRELLQLQDVPKWLALAGGGGVDV